MSFEDPQQPLPRGPTSQPYRGPRRTHRETGQTEVWVEGAGYVPETDLRRLPQQERDTVESARMRAQQFERALPDFERFAELNRTNPTGAWSQIVGSWTNQPQLIADPDIDEMRSITERWAPRQREPGSGTTTDRDIALFKGGIPNVTRTGDGNARVIEALRRQAREESSYADFVDWYWPRTGSLSGADQAWRGYRNAHPNIDRPWREYFAPQRPRGVPETAQWNAQSQQWEE